MLEVIDPVSLPLWAVLAFAVSMYPLGLLLPGCVCCGGGNCTTCGDSTQPYENQYSSHGRMCCSGSLAGSVTLRITRTSAATITKVVRGSGATYGKTTDTYNCSDIEGDYVLPLTRTTNGSGFGWTCDWGARGLFGASPPVRKWFLSPRSDSGIEGSYAWPNWALFSAWYLTMTGSRRTQSCTFDADLGTESCTVGTTNTNVSGLGYAWFDDGNANCPGDYNYNYNYAPFNLTILKATSGPYTSQACNPAGRTLFTGFRFANFADCTYTISLP